MRKILAVTFMFMVIYTGISQDAYTKKKYGERIVQNIEYGKDTGYTGEVVSLKLDIHYPLGDSNCLRPIIIVVHGGAWIGGDKAGGGLRAICREFSSRGYLVATVNYRLGMHPAASYTPYALCPHEKCAYVADSAEWYRAAFRAAQDVKSAIRFLKNRSHLDSSDKNNVFLLGESAGAYTSILAAWLDKEAEKFWQCGSITNAPAADPDLTHCTINNPGLSRPDLGSVHGKGNLGNSDATIQGVAAFYGGVLDTSVFMQKLAGDTPVLYMFHQTCDVVVDNNKGRIFWKLFYYCYAPLNLCQPYYSSVMSWGSSAIARHIDSMKGIKPRFKLTLLTGQGSYNCDVNSNCHGIDNIGNRMNEVAEFFAPVIRKRGNVPTGLPCNLSLNPPNTPKFAIFPNPADNKLTITQSSGNKGNNISYILTGMNGKKVFSGIFPGDSHSFTIDIPTELSNGLYNLSILAESHTHHFQIQVLR